MKSLWRSITTSGDVKEALPYRITWQWKKRVETFRQDNLAENTSKNESNDEHTYSAKDAAIPRRTGLISLRTAIQYPITIMNFP